jgi:hypothetical protein
MRVNVLIATLIATSLMITGSACRDDRVKDGQQGKQPELSLVAYQPILPGDLGSPIDTKDQLDFYIELVGLSDTREYIFVRPMPGGGMLATWKGSQRGEWWNYLPQRDAGEMFVPLPWRTDRIWFVHTDGSLEAIGSDEDYWCALFTLKRSLVYGATLADRTEFYESHTWKEVIWPAIVNSYSERRKVRTDG